jgi:hypothetical protein
VRRTVLAGGQADSKPAAEEYARISQSIEPAANGPSEGGRRKQAMPEAAAEVLVAPRPAPSKGAYGSGFDRSNVMRTYIRPRGE